MHVNPDRFLKKAAIALSFLLLAGCADAVADSTADGELHEQPVVVTEPVPVEEIRIGLAVQSLDRTFFTGMRDGAIDQAEQRGVSIEIIDGGDDHTTQLAEVNALLDDIDVLLLSPVDSAQSAEIVASASARGIPVVAVANQVGSVDEYGPQFVHPHTFALVTNDDVTMGRKAGAFVALQSLTEPVEIAVLSGARGTANVTMRRDGFEQELDALGIDYTIVGDIDGGWNAEGGTSACVAFAGLEPDLIFSMSDAMTAGCAEALAALGVAIPVVSIGGNADGIGLLVERRIVGSVCQKPGDMGALAVDVGIDALDAQPTRQGLQFYETPLVTTETLDRCEPQW